MSEHETYKNSYWCGKGRYKDLLEALNKLIPSEGEVKGSKNKKLERFRKLQNAYYDLYNNGGCNRSRAISSYFGVSAYLQREVGGWSICEIIAKKTEPVIDRAIIEAAREQGLVD